jgi:hypothetical protein
MAQGVERLSDNDQVSSTLLRQSTHMTRDATRPTRPALNPHVDRRMLLAVYCKPRPTIR